MASFQLRDIVRLWAAVWRIVDRKWSDLPQLRAASLSCDGEVTSSLMMSVESIAESLRNCIARCDSHAGEVGLAGYDLSA